jgi:3D (Asp-Asp-Asp) domain-containing protein
LEVFTWQAAFLARKYARGVLAAIVILTLIFGISFPGQAFAGTSIFEWVVSDKKTAELYLDYMQNFSRDFGVLPESEEREPSHTITVPATAYTSDPAETDSTPFITASGTRVRRGVVAANFLPIGTRVRIPEIYGDEVFVVEDRMNKRYNKRIDIWMEEKSDAREFGIKKIELEIF